MTDRVRITELATDDLLRDLGGPAPSRGATVKLWLDSAPYYPGTTRIRAATLHAEYADWCRQHLDMIGLPIEKWGVEMRKYLRYGRGKTGIFYYTSRDPHPDIPTDPTPETPQKINRDT